MLLPALANRHGLIAGATGTGKTVTLQTLAESFSRIGVPVFMADVKGDLTGISQTGERSGKAKERIERLAARRSRARACPSRCGTCSASRPSGARDDVRHGPAAAGAHARPERDPAGVLQLVFKIADDNGLLLLDLKDLRAMLQHVGDNAAEFTTRYGNMSAASIGAIQRGLLRSNSQGGDRFFGEPMPEHPRLPADRRRARAWSTSSPPTSC